MKNILLSIAFVLIVSVSLSLKAESGFPEGAKGFAGLISAKVVTKGEGQITVEVLKIEKAWKHSKAENTESLVGKQVVLKIVPATYDKKKDGKEYLGTVQKFFALLKVGDTEKFDVRNIEGDSLTFLELTEEQQKKLGK